MSLVCCKCGGEIEEKQTTLQTNVERLTLSIEGIHLYVCKNCEEITLEANDAKIIQKITSAFDDKMSEPKQTMVSNEECSDVLNLQEVASLLRVSHQTIYNMIKDKRLKGYKVGREWRFLRQELADYIPMTPSYHPTKQDKNYWMVSDK